MLRFVSVLALLAATASASAQRQNLLLEDPSLAKILKEQRFNAGDGRAGAAFATEDGQIFKEETDVDGNRIGQYSYIGDDGRTYTVRYSAGKDGFRILDGAHIPSGGQDAAAFDPNFGVAEEEVILQEPAVLREPAPAPRRAFRPANNNNNVIIGRQQPQQQQPRFRPQPQPAPQPQLFEQPRQPAADPNRNPFINPHDPTHRNFQFNRNAVKFDPENPLAKQLALVPPCAGCEGLNPFVNPFDESHQAGLLAGHLAGAPQPRALPAPAPRRRPAPAAPRPQQQLLLDELTTPAPNRAAFFPPGQLNLNRHETGFEFNFES